MFATMVNARRFVMFSGVYDAAGAMVVQMNRVNNISNNIANVNTVGFKQERINMKTWSRIWGEANDRLPIMPDTAKAARFINETADSTPHLDKSYIDFSQGPFKHTGNRLDFAIEGRGFFLVLTKNGIRYTRDGQFTLTKDGTLVQRGTGYPVIGENYFRNGQLIKLNARNSLIRSDGTVIVDKNKIDTIAVRDFSNYANLKKLPNHLFEPVNDQQPKKVNSFTLAGGYLEMSNVKIVREMVKLIEAQRSFERYQKVIDALGNDIMSDVVRNISKVT